MYTLLKLVILSETKYLSGMEWRVIEIYENVIEMNISPIVEKTSFNLMLIKTGLIYEI